MASNVEKLACTTLREVLAPLKVGEIIQGSDKFDSALSALEWYVAEVLENKCKNPEGLDGLYSGTSIKTANNGFELTGMCIFITDQTLTPVNLRTIISEEADEFEWFNCKLGELTPYGMMRIPYSSSKWGKYMYNIQVDSIDWMYDIEINNS